MKKPFLTNRLPFLFFIIAVIFFITASPFSFSEFPLDDAWIHRVYARAIAYGHGLAYNASVQEAGSTSPLWSMVTAPAHWFEFLGTGPVVLLIKIFGIFLGLISIIQVRKLSSHLTGSEGVGIITASFFALEPRLLYSVLSGMETPLLLALILGGTLALLHEKRRAAVILFGLTPLVRPEALLFFPILLIILIRQKKSSWTRWTVDLILLGLPMLAWSLFCLLTNGHLLPNTFYVKTTSFQMGWETLRTAWLGLTQYGYGSLFVFLFGIAACLVGILTQKKSIVLTYFLMLFLGPILYLLGVAGSRRIILVGYYWTRWIDPAAILLTLSFCMGYAILLTRGFEIIKQVVEKGMPFLKQKSAPILLTGIVGLLSFALLMISLPSFTKSFLNRRSYLASDSRVIYAMNVQCGKWIHDHVPPDATVGIIDAGAIKYFGKRHTIDLTGLNDADLAFQRKRRTQAIDECDWLAVFSIYFRGTHVLDAFEPRMMFQVPFEEYTIGTAREQTTKMVYERKK